MGRIMQIFLLICCCLWAVDGKGFSLKMRRKHHYAVKNNKTLGPLMDVYGSKMHVSEYNVIYEALISLGTPPKTFSVIMDTGSDMLWVPHVGCKNTGQLGERCGTDDVYNEKDSSTGVDTKEPFEIKYGIGSTVGTYFEDVFAVGDGTVDGDRGILGLSFAAYNERGTAIFGQAVEEGLMDAPIFTVLYKKCPPLEAKCKDGGMITFGEHDKKRCGPILGYAPINPNTLHWEFMLDELSIGSYIYNIRTKVITDTGASHMNIAPTVYRNIISAMKARPYGTSGRSYQIPCDSKFEIKLKINGIQYTIPVSAITTEVDNQNNCLLMMSPRKSDSEHWNLGDPWVRSYCHIHDWKQRRVGFASPI